MPPSISLDALISDASTVLRQANGQLIYITQALKDALDADLKRNNKGSELQWTALFDGITETNYNGVQMLAIPFLDEIIKGLRKPSAAGKAWNKPYRALYTIKDDLLSVWRAKAKSPTFRYGSTRTSR